MWTLPAPSSLSPNKKPAKPTHTVRKINKEAGGYKPVHIKAGGVAGGTWKEFSIIIIIDRTTCKYTIFGEGSRQTWK